MQISMKKRIKSGDQTKFLNSEELSSTPEKMIWEGRFLKAPTDMRLFKERRAQCDIIRWDHAEPEVVEDRMTELKSKKLVRRLIA